MTRLIHTALCPLLAALAAPAQAETGERPFQLALQSPPAALNASPDLWLPAPLDGNAALVARYLDWLAAETGAPAVPGWPSVSVEPLPTSIRMGFLFPTEAAPWQEMRIAVSPQSLDRARGDETLAVLGELAHEYAHYALLMARHGWQGDRDTYSGGEGHHCDPEFQRLTAGMDGDVIWQTYHSADALRSISFMIDRACWRDGHVWATSHR